MNITKAIIYCSFKVLKSDIFKKEHNKYAAADIETVRLRDGWSVSYYPTNIILAGGSIPFRDLIDDFGFKNV